MSGPFCWLTSPGANVRVHRFGKRGACARASAAYSLRDPVPAFQFGRRKSLKPRAQIVAKNQGSSARFPRAQLPPLDRRIKRRLADASGGYRLRDCEGQGIGHRNFSPWVSAGGSWCATAKRLAGSVSRNSPREIVAPGFSRTIFSPNITMASIKGFRRNFHWDDFLGRPARARGVKWACLLASRQTSSNWVGPSENVSRSAFSFSRRISGLSGMLQRAA